MNELRMRGSKRIIMICKRYSWTYVNDLARSCYTVLILSVIQQRNASMRDAAPP